MSKETKQKSNNNKKIIHAHGRRKEAVSRVRLLEGKGTFTVNGKSIEEYFPSAAQQSLYLQPFRLTKTEGKFWATIKVVGSGKKGQLDATVHGLARALNEVNKKEFRPILKKAGFLTRDSRVKERRKYGRAQKARKGKQSPKR
ncbi:MAG: 30S ribosomal protein S9 [Candidatus Curtissbacteria bacterium GW2011_GWA1_40_9]|uniref:Small ribosomal subunit protein uS9 n=1 Tax=Candidatus Curtissbacteria bacterium GW2011_GWA1_40_9 TaxID=1618408 RepID=A0A0G0TT43_9BACT|nr:MAG: 30S ribosomal protein S9 [Candidatus Curtissbacteria bacterium GW2011_GWA1_40_9]